MPNGEPSSSTTGNQPSAVISIGKQFARTSANGVAASNMTAGLQSVLLIEHWYPGKYSVSCTLDGLARHGGKRNDVAAAGRLCTTLSAPKAMVARFLHLPRGGTILRYGIHIASRAGSPAVC